MNKDQIKATAERIAELGGYSYDRYADWAGVARKLLTAGLTERETEAVMRSKWARWAADGYGGRYGKTPASALLAFVKKQGDAEVKKLTAEHFA